MDIIAIALALLGTILASFIGVLVERVHTGESWIQDRSKCNSCSTTLGLLDLVPVASWLATYGKCGHCGIRLPFMYVASEVVLGVLFVASYYTLGLGMSLALLLVALCVLLFVVLYDIRHTIVPTWAAALFVLISAGFAYSTSFDHTEFGITLTFAGVIGLVFFLMHALSRGRMMGLGDSPIALGLSLLVGFGSAFAGLIFSFWIGALYGICVLVMRRGGPRMGIEVPFVPFLAAGYLLAYFTQWNPFLF